VPESPVTANVWWATRKDASAHLEALLDDTERDRYQGYRRLEDRERFLVGCSLAKTVAAARLDRPVTGIVLDRSCTECGKPHGKPVVRGTDLELSVSHSGDRIAVALAIGTPIGVDVEQVEGRSRHPGGDDPDALLHYVLADGEVTDIARQQPDIRHRSFLIAWTRKEAVTKATGDGLRVSFKDVIVSPATEAPMVLAWPYQERPESVSMFDLDPGEGYVASLAVIGRCDAVIAGDGSALLA
jgi:4'-phosphopantetheinyl transferase